MRRDVRTLFAGAATKLMRKRGLSVQSISSLHSSLVRIHGRVSRLALAAGLGVALTATLTLPANAFFGLASAPRPVGPVMVPPVTVPLTSPVRPKVVRPRPKAGPALPNELAAKAQGPLTVVISLDRQELTLYSGGAPIARSRVSSGKAGHGTPTGIFSVIEKDRWHRSNLYDDAPMYYMNRITWSGVALHQGVVPNYPASHGCIRLPEAFARQLFGVTRLGTRVIVTRGEAAPADITHAALFVPVKPPAPAPEVVAELPPVFSDELQPIHPHWLKTAMLAGAAPIRLETNEAKLTDPAGDAAGQKKPLKAGAISVFVSKKEGKLFVRKGFQPVLEAPVTIARADEPIGTHVFTALATDDANGSARWQVVSVPSSGKAPKLDAAAALDRIGIPAETRARISALLSPGASLIVSDHGLGSETGQGTDFIVQTR
jgi:lipoprotein-anchoring transpeptidase ErfK/SrfK